ncbi:hypothetical protein NQZ68_029750 [Dissostichus eleginoides]|nr:hypothetical protein NQZ68_029750 [Dissostichus eleginoides]
MRRIFSLFIVNFLVPIMFLFCLDLASFLMSDKGGEKVSFKVTLLLAVTVMQLILNDVLPSSSDEVPIIAIFCFGTFGLMFISLLETILVMYLIEKDSASEESNADKGLSKDCGDKQGNYDGDTGSQLMEESNSLEKLLEELSEAVKTLSLLLTRKEERKRKCWTRVARILDNVNRLQHRNYNKLQAQLRAQRRHVDESA